MSRRLLLLVPLLVAADAPKPPPPAEAKPAVPWAEDLQALHKDGRLYDKRNYAKLRAATARRFAEAHAADIDAALPAGDGSPRAWLDAHPDVRDDLLTAILEAPAGSKSPPLLYTPDLIVPAELLKEVGPGRDNLVGVLEAFAALVKASPALVEKYPQLAVAVAVTWDQPRAVYDHRYHARRVGGKLPEAAAGEASSSPPADVYPDGVATFKALAEGEPTAFQWAGLPWEFLLFVVDHRTPLSERPWARKYATSKPPGQWYADVPYDNGLLNSEIGKGKVSAKGTLSGDAGARMAGQEYTLANLKAKGGVCAHQADFADRVGKSVGVPGFYCSGQTNQGGAGHAWWMYVSVKAAKDDKVQFTMESVGRYRGMQFYTGDAVDPQTGQKVKDRDIERRLFAVGQDRTAARHARLLMRLAPWLAEQEKWTAKQRAGFLDRVLRVSPLCDEAWREFARLVKEEGLGETNKEVVREHVRPILKTYAAYPDFVAAVLADFEPVFAPDEMLKLYTQAATTFAAGGRADLLCDMRMRATDLFVAQKQTQKAFDGLAETVQRFPTEGRYIPALTLKMQELAPSVKKGPEKLGQLYLTLVPQLVAHFKKNNLAQYDDDMYKQARAYFTAQNMPKQAEQLRAACGK